MTFGQYVVRVVDLLSQRLAWSFKRFANFYTDHRYLDFLMVAYENKQSPDFATYSLHKEQRMWS